MESIIRTFVTKIVTEIEEETRARAEPLSGNEFLAAFFAKAFPKPEAEPTAAPSEETHIPTESEEQQMAHAPVTPEKKKPRAKKEKAVAAPAAPATPEQEPKPEPVAPPAPKKPRAKKEKAPVRLDKLTATQTKQFKKMADEFKVEVDKKVFLEHVNALPEEDYAAHTLEEHMKAFLHSRTGGVAAPPPPPTPEPEAEEELECVEVEFEGATYYVNPEDKKIYKEENGAHVFVGYAGMAAFEKLILPENA